MENVETLEKVTYCNQKKRIIHVYVDESMEHKYEHWEKTEVLWMI